jgi:glycosyltransferase involved in cell wall biosynthesis
MPHINFIAFRSGTNSILTIHDFSFARYSEFFRLNNNIWHWAVNVKGLVNKFSQVIAVSEHTKRDIVQLTGVSADKVKVIYSGVGSDYRPLAQADSELMRVRQKYHLPEKFILFLGTIEPRKNIISLIKAYEQLRQDNNYADVALIIAGAIGGASAKILRYARNSKFSASIKFIGYVDSLDKNPLYNLATVFAFPSFYEGFGFPPLEAMASGTPVVAGWGTSLAEIVGTAGILINPDDSQDLANGLNLVLSDANLAQSLRDRGLAQASRFSWTKCALGYLELINNANIK